MALDKVLASDLILDFLGEFEADSSPVTVEVARLRRVCYLLETARAIPTAEDWALDYQEAYSSNFDLILGHLIGDESIGVNSDDSVETRYFLSAGIVEGGVATDNGDGTIDVSLGSGYFRPTNDPLDNIEFLSWATTTNLTVTLDETRYVGILYNGGSPVVEVHTTNDFDGQTGFMLAVLVNEDDNVVHVTTHEPHSGDIARHLSEFHHAVFHIMRASGLAVSELGTRNLKVSAGVIAVAEDLINFAELDTSGAGRFDAYYGGFTKVAGLSQWPNEQYDLNDTLTNMTNNRYGNLFLYVEPDGEAAIIYGDDQYVTAAQAEAASPPSSVPPRIREHGVLIAQLVFQKSAGTLTSILSPFVTQFDAAGVTTHNDLVANGGTDSHATIQSHMDDGDIHIKHNVSAGSPDADNDSTEGYSVGSHWFRPAGQVWICKNPSPGAAVWEQISFAVNAFSQSADPTVNNDNTQGLHAGSIWANTTASPNRVFQLKDPATGAADWIQLVDSTNAFKIAIPFYIENPETGKEYPVKVAHAAFTINKIKHQTEAGEACDFQLNIRTQPRVSGTNVFSSAKSSNETYTDETTFAEDAVGAEESIAIVFSGTPTATKIFVNVLGTINA